MHLIVLARTIAPVEDDVPTPIADTDNPAPPAPADKAEEVEEEPEPEPEPPINDDLCNLFGDFELLSVGDEIKIKPIKLDNVRLLGYRSARTVLVAQIRAPPGAV